MFRKINVPLLGIVENMSHYQCPACGHKEHIFGQEGAIKTAQTMRMDVLGQVSLQHRSLPTPRIQCKWVKLAQDQSGWRLFIAPTRLAGPADPTQHAYLMNE